MTCKSGSGCLGVGSSPSKEPKPSRVIACLRALQCVLCSDTGQVSEPHVTPDSETTLQRFGVFCDAGYDVGWFDTLDHIRCGMCMCVVRDPLTSARAQGCSHSFCRTCISSWAAVWDREAECPVCAEPLQLPEMDRDIGLAQEVAGCNVTCMVGECWWKGSFGHEGAGLQQHLETHSSPLPAVVGQCGGKRRHQLIPNVCKPMYVRYAQRPNSNAEKASSDLTRPFRVPASTIRDWMKDKGNSYLPGRRRAPSSNENMIALGQKREMEIYLEIKKRRDELRFVTVEAIQMLAMQGAPATFRASRSWLDRFFRDYNLTLKIPTFRKRTKVAGDNGEGLRESILEHWHTVNALRQHHNIQLKNIVNYDQIRLSYESHLRYVVDFAGTERAEVFHEGQEKKCVTVILSAAADGTKFPPHVIFAGKDLGRLKIQKPPKPVTFGCTPSSWDNHRYHVDVFMAQSFESLQNGTRNRVVLSYMRSVLETGVFTHDHAPCHTHPYVESTAASRWPFMHLALIPKHATGNVQVMDVGVNKPFRNLVAKQCTSFFSSRPTTDPSLSASLWRNKLLEWVSEAWHQIRPESIRQTFKSVGLSGSLDGSDDHRVTVIVLGKPLKPLRSSNYRLHPNNPTSFCSNCPDNVRPQAPAPVPPPTAPLQHPTDSVQQPTSSPQHPAVSSQRQPTAPASSQPASRPRGRPPKRKSTSSARSRTASPSSSASASTASSTASSADSSSSSSSSSGLISSSASSASSAMSVSNIDVGATSSSSSTNAANNFTTSSRSTASSRTRIGGNNDRSSSNRLDQEEKSDRVLRPQRRVISYREASSSSSSDGDDVDSDDEVDSGLTYSDFSIGNAVLAWWGQAWYAGTVVAKDRETQTLTIQFKGQPHTHPGEFRTCREVHDVDLYSPAAVSYAV